MDAKYDGLTENGINSLCTWMTKMRNETFEVHLEEYRELLTIAAGLDPNRTPNQILSSFGLLKLEFLQLVLARETSDIPL